jgi:hypothetical protein
MPPPPGMAGASFFFGVSATMASVVIRGVVTTNKIASRARSACLQPVGCNRWPNHLASRQMPYRDPANEWRSARERHGQNDIMSGVRRYDLS